MRRAGAGRGRMLGLGLGLGLAACGHPTAPHGGTPVTAALAAPDAGVAVIDADEAALQDERLAAIQKAMNELDEAAQGCWAAAAVVRFDIEGEVEMRVEIGRARSAATPVRDTTRNAALTRCLVELFDTYRWAPPLDGQTIQLPFRFRAPDGQSVIDRALVPWAGQTGRSVAVLLDEANTGAEDASMFELALAAGASTGLRRTDRAELWYFLGPASVVDQARGVRTAVAAEQLMTVPAGGSREVIASAGAVHAVVIVTPGGVEGTGRAGALPTPEVTTVDRPDSGPRVRGSTPTLWTGPVHAFAFDAELVSAGAGVPIPPGGPGAPATELFYVTAGTGTLVIGIATLPVTATSVIQIPARQPRTLTPTTPLRALRVRVHPPAP